MRTMLSLVALLLIGGCSCQRNAEQSQEAATVAAATAPQQEQAPLAQPGQPIETAFGKFRLCRCRLYPACLSACDRRQAMERSGQLLEWWQGPFPTGRYERARSPGSALDAHPERLTQTARQRIASTIHRNTRHPSRPQSDGHYRDNRLVPHAPEGRWRWLGNHLGFLAASSGLKLHSLGRVMVR
jgi:hypothetical protein